MSAVTVTGSGFSSILVYSTDQAAPYAQTLANALNAGISEGVLTPLTYTRGAVAPGATDGVVFFNASPLTTVAIPTDDVGIVVAAQASITGGARGETVVAGTFSGGLTYTDITPSGSKVDYIAAGDGPNLITTSTLGIGNYQVELGAGNDTVSVVGNGLINAGTGSNSVSVSGGSSLIYSEGADDITASGVGTDTVMIGTGQPTIHPGDANLVVSAGSGATGALFVAPGMGSDTISVGEGGGTVYGGTAGYNILVAGAGGVSGAATFLHGAANGDQLVASGSTPVTLTAGGGNETLTGAGGTFGDASVAPASGNNVFVAGSGNATLIAGAGNDTLVGGSGTALMMSGTGSDFFSFTLGTAGGRDTITGFKAADHLELTGYGLTTLPTTMSGGSTIVTLNDGTTVTLQGVSALNPGQVLLK